MYLLTGYKNEWSPPHPAVSSILRDIAAGGITSNVHDLNKFVISILQLLLSNDHTDSNTNSNNNSDNQSNRNNPLLAKSSTLKQMLIPQRESGIDLGNQVGLGWVVKGMKVKNEVYHNNNMKYNYWKK